MTVLLTTHDMEEADVLCDSVAIMHRGRIVAVGSPEELKAEIGGSASLDDVFVHFTGSALEEGSSYRETARTRRLTRRLS
jgi:ABC-2 type transport system ATP-binding protein